MVALESVFDKLNIHPDKTALEFLKDAKLAKEIYASVKKKKIYLDISLKDFLPIEIWEKIDIARAQALWNTKINLKIENLNYPKNLIWDYIEFIKCQKAQTKNKLVWKMIQAQNAIFDQPTKTISFKAINSSEKEAMEGECRYLKKKMAQFGFEDLTLQVTLEKDSTNDLLAEQEEVYLNIAKKQLREQEQHRNNVPDAPVSEKYKKTNAVILEKPSYKNFLDIEDEAQNVVIHGQIIQLDIRKSKTGRKIYSLIVTDYNSSIRATYFGRDEKNCLLDPLTEEEKNQINSAKLREEHLKTGDWIALKGRTGWSSFEGEVTFTIDSFKKLQKNIEIREDTHPRKRVELHVHSKMSVMDGVNDISEYIERADFWNWTAIALTDHINVQAFPDAFKAIKKTNAKRKIQNLEPLKLIYGSELTMLKKNEFLCVRNPQNTKLNEAKYVVFDLETTGLSPEFDEIIEFGASIYDYSTGERKKIDWLIKPEKALKDFTIELTNITNEMLANEPPITVVFPKIYALIKDAILVAHNANFDFFFLQSWAKKMGYPPLTNTVIDTLAIARVYYPDLKNYRLGTVAKKTGILYDEKNAHRGDYDADVLTDVFERIWSDAKKDFTLLNDGDWNKLVPQKPKKNMNYVKTRGYHVTVLAKNQQGLKELYQIISKTHTENLLGTPKIFQEDLQEIRKHGNLLIGSSCVNGEIFEMAKTASMDRLQAAMSFYDYIEIQPLSVYKHLWQNGTLTFEEVQRTVQIIIKLAKKANKLVVATSDAHYLDIQNKIVRDVYIHTKGLGGVSHPLFDYKHRIKDYPDQYLRSTTEMLEEFNWLEDKQLINEIVVENSLKIAAMIDLDIEPVKTGTYDPKIENVNKLLRDKCYETTHKLYGQQLPKIVEERLEKELSAIIKHGFAVVYWISHKLVAKSLADGYLVGSRGSVGSSFVARASEITEVNPLKAHYRCGKCLFSDFNTPKNFKCGYDLPIRNCPNCNQKLIGDGHDIPFETFLGFNGDKVPDIDLNFSGDYQPIAHNFVKEMFGKNNCFRAGTISTVADKTAYNYVKKYFEEFKPTATPRKVEIERLAKLATGVKRTTGQHPGGIIILPSGYDIEDFSPVNYPADDFDSSWKTTHFDFSSIHDNLLKMDILGHLDPTALKMLRDITGIDPLSIPMDDPQVYSLFSSLKALGINAQDINGESTGAIGIPEFGTSFVRGMLRDTNPKTFADLVQISGLSHGTDVWLNNAQNKIREGSADISSVIGCRDDIMVYLMEIGLEKTTAFMIMEAVRKGQGLKDDWIKNMQEHQVPDWYIDSCQKIKYMFPKAHATAYVLMAYRIAWFKIYYPAEYYATFFSTRSNAFELKTVLAGKSEIEQRMKELDQKIVRKEANTREIDLLTTLEVVLEMKARGITILNIDCNKSLATRFLVETDESGKKNLYPPFNVVDSLGGAVGESIVKARKAKTFSSVNDLKLRSQITQTQLKIFAELKITESISNSEQLTFEF